ncbi:MAG: SWIM zinc finger family protein [Methanosarcinales archaeon]|nr:SWIM zinc finger family protein [Methanosarcinales archaeon]
MGRYEDFWGGYTPSKPIQVEGGIKAKSKRGSIGDTWWSKRWVNVLESFGWSNRLERGRRYARKGQVLDFEISAGKVEATVQGSVNKPYLVTIEIKPITEKAWDHVIEEMSQKAIFAAKLLAGEMPDDIEDAFEAADVSLFPIKSKDIATHCSCPDSANPCKHIAALYYILAEEFDRDPFMIFELRGRTKDEISLSLRQKRSGGNENLPEPEERPEGVKQKEVALSMDDFWVGRMSESFSVTISPPDVSAAVIKLLGTPQFWDSKDDFVEKMGGYYEEISRRAIETAYGEQRGAKKKTK